MEPLPTGLTWKDVVARFSEDSSFSLTLSQRNRRTNRTKRAKGETEDRLVWRLIVQKRQNGKQATILRKNLKDAGAGLLGEKLSEKMTDHLNGLIG